MLKKRLKEMFKFFTVASIADKIILSIVFIVSTIFGVSAILTSMFFFVPVILIVVFSTVTIVKDNYNI